MQKSEQINELATALAKAQASVKAALKDHSNPFFKSKYADLSSVWEACRKALSENGLSVSQLPSTGEGQAVGLETMLLHSSGQWLSEKMTAPVAKWDAQGIGSAITYLRRYALAAMVGVVADEDDDGEKAVGRNGSGKAEIVKIDQKVKDAVVTQSREAIASGDDLKLKQIWSEFDTDQKVVLWGLFNSQERRTMKELMGPQ